MSRNPTTQDSPAAAAPTVRSERALAVSGTGASLSHVPRLPIDPGLQAPTPGADEIQRVVDGAIRLAEFLQRSTIGRISVAMDGVRWDIEAPSAGAPVAPPLAVAAAPAAAPAEPSQHAAAGQPLTAPLVGVFHLAKSPGAAPFVEVGSRVEAGQQVAIVEAMKMMNEVVADRAGVITGVHAEDGEVVEYGQPLFTLDGP